MAAKKRSRRGVSEGRWSFSKAKPNTEPIEIDNYLVFGCFGVVQG